MTPKEDWPWSQFKNQTKQTKDKLLQGERLHQNLLTYSASYVDNRIWGTKYVNTDIKIPGNEKKDL